MPDGYDEPVNLHGDFEEVMTAFLQVDPNVVGDDDESDDDPEA